MWPKKKITDKNQINNCIIFIKKLFTEKLQIQNENITAYQISYINQTRYCISYINQISFPVLTREQSQTCEGPILESELLKALKNMSNNKSLANDGLTKEFYEAFWEDLKKPLCATCKSFSESWVKSFSETSSYKT